MKNNLLLLSLALLLLPLFTQAQSPASQQAYITVTGEASRQVPADYLEISIRAEGSGATAAEAQQMVTERIDDAVNYLKLSKAVSHVSSSYARIQPNKALIATSDFRAFQEASFRLTNISSYNEVVVALLDKGITNLSVSGPGLNNPEALKQEVMTLALQKARQKAELLAVASGQSLGAVLFIEEHSAGGIQPYFKSVATEQVGKPAFSEAQVNFSKSITVRFALKPD